MLCIKKGIWLAGLPFVFSVITVLKKSVAMFVFFILVHFVILKIIPSFRHSENIGMFVIVAFSSIPINIYLFKLLVEMELLFDSFLVVNILRGVLCYIVLLSVEEVIMGVLTRWIWKKQYKIRLD